MRPRRHVVSRPAANRDGIGAALLVDLGLGLTQSREGIARLARPFGCAEGRGVVRSDAELDVKPYCTGAQSAFWTPSGSLSMTVR